MEYFAHAGADHISGISLKDSDATTYFNSVKNDAFKLFFNFVFK